MEFVLDILRFIGILFLVLMVFNLLIIVHEWGHFLAGRWRGLMIDRFQIWFGKPIWKKTVNGVQYGLGSIPAGGFVSLPQMAPMESIEGTVVEEGEEKKELPPITPLDKIIVAFAGPLFSFLLAVVFAVVVWAVGKPIEEASTTTVIGSVAEDSAAEKAGLEPGDDIQYINGKRVKQFLGMNDSVKWLVISSEVDDIKVDVLRDGEEKSFVVETERPEPDEVDGGFARKAWAGLVKRPKLRTIGVGPATTPVVIGTMENSPASALDLQPGDIIAGIDGKPITRLGEVFDHPVEAGKPVAFSVKRGDEILEKEIVPQKPDQPADFEKALTGIIYDGAGIRSIVHISPTEQVVNSFRTIVGTLRAVFSPKSDVSAGHLSGPIGIMGLYYDLFQHKDGWRLVLWFSVILNINLAILNMLPFPVLDGGHIVMAAIEWVRRRPMNLKVLEVVQTAFVLLLLGFMVFVSFKDVGDRVPKGEEVVPPKFLPESET